MTDATDIAAYDAWREERLAQVSGPVGNIALVDYQPVSPEPQAVRGLPATVRRVEGEAGVRVAPTDGGLTLRTAHGDVPVTDETVVPFLQPDGLPLLVAGSITADVFSLDGADVELRIYDAASPRIDEFDGIETCEHDPAWVLEGVFEAHDETQRVPWGFTRESDSGHTKAVPGIVRVTIGGVEHAFTVFADGPALVLVLADATTGVESYAPGRFLRMDAAEDGETVTLDLNRAIVPPCGFSDFYSCPIPPAENRIAVPVRAGEMRARWR